MSRLGGSTLQLVELNLSPKNFGPSIWALSEPRRQIRRQRDAEGVEGVGMGAEMEFCKILMPKKPSAGTYFIEFTHWRV